jgi:hypothetical protein
MNHQLRSRYVPIFLLMAAAGSVSPLYANHILGYQFNDAPGSTTATADGSAAGSAPTLNIVAPATIGADGSGVSGLPGDRAFNNSAATSMGGTINGSGGRGMHAADFDAIDGLLKFTIAGWFKTDSTASIGANAVLFDNRTGVSGVRVHGDPNTPGNLVLAVDNGSNSSSGFSTTQEWVNFAVTYDGTILQPGPNVFFYAGDIDTPLTLVGSGTNTNGSGNDPASNDSNALIIGSRITFGTSDGDPFDGLIDNIRVWGEVVPVATLDATRLSDTGVPEPTSLVILLLGFTGLAVTGRSARA